MPAVGFAMLMNIMFKWNLAPFFAVGFVAVAYLELPILAVAIIAAAIAAYDYFIGGETGNKTQVATSAGGIEEDEEDYSDGI